MKKCFYILTLLFLALPLCACNGYAELNDKYIVSAIGFDYQDNKIQAFAETISSTAENTEPQVFKASGSSAKQAVFNFGQTLSRSLVVDHCSVVAIGQNISGETLEDIINFCFDVKNLNHSVLFISCADIQSVFQTEVSQTAIGYDIMALLKIRQEKDGINYKNRFYQIQKQRKSKTDIFSLPYLSSDGQTLVLQGEQIYENLIPTILLNNTESGIYALMRNRFSSGNLFIGQEFAHINNAKTKISGSQDALCKIDAKTYSPQFLTSLQNETKALMEKIAEKTESSLDIPLKIKFDLRQESYE